MLTATHERLQAALSPITGRPLGLIRRPGVAEIRDMLDPRQARARRQLVSLRRTAAAGASRAPMLRLEGTIGDAIRADLVADFLDRNRGGDAVSLGLDSDGGDVHEAIAIAQLLAGARPAVRCRVAGACHSAAVLILAGADWRIASRRATFSLHDRVAVGLPSQASAAALRRRLGSLEQDDIRCRAHLAARTRLSAAAWAQFEREGRTLTATTARSIGLIDEVLR